MSDGHPGQMAAMKLAVDRILPVSMFEAAKNSGTTPQISINISGLQGPTVDVAEDVTDVEDVKYKISDTE